MTGYPVLIVLLNQLPYVAFQYLLDFPVLEGILNIPVGGVFDPFADRGNDDLKTGIFADPHQFTIAELIGTQKYFAINAN